MKRNPTPGGLHRQTIKARPVTTRTSVLTVDHNEVTLKTRSASLRLAGFETVEAPSGGQALALAKRRRFDVIVVDIHLSDMDGLQLIRQLRASGVTSRIIVATDFPTCASAFQAGALGVDAYLEDVLLGNELIDAVKRATEAEKSQTSGVTSGACQNGVDAHVTEEPHVPLDPRIRRILSMVDRDPCRPWSTEVLANAIGLSASGLRHLFRTQTGLSLRAYRAERRLVEAARRLRTTNDDVRQIAHSIGFGVSALRDFRHAFRVRFGVSPREYRACIPADSRPVQR